MFHDDSRAKSSLRISFSPSTTLEEVKTFKEALIKVISSVKWG